MTRLLCNTTDHVFDVSDERVGGEFAFKRQAGSETAPDCRQILMMADHVHMLMSIPPKYAVSQVVGFIKGEERDPFGAGVCREEEKLRGATFLGPRLLCVDGRT